MRRPIPQGKKGIPAAVWPPEWYHLQDFRVLLGERERYGHRSIPGCDLAESPATDCILDFVVKFAMTRGGRGYRDADDLAARGNRELERYLSLEPRLLFEVFIVDMP